MTKRIDVPCYVRYIVQSIFEPSQAYGHLINKIFIIHVGLIRHAPTCIHEMKLFISNQSSHCVSLLLWCLVPPSIEEGHLYDCELVLGIISELRNDGINGVLNSCKLCSCVSTIVVVVYSFEPSYIIVRMWDEMDSEFGPIFRIFFFMMLFHHFLICISQSWEGRTH